MQWQVLTRLGILLLSLAAASLLIFLVVQVPLSVWWLHRHEQGPLEWAWSRLTYGSAGARGLARAAGSGSRG